MWAERSSKSVVVVVVYMSNFVICRRWYMKHGVSHEPSNNLLCIEKKR